jgi:hypothetical protein
MQSLKGAGLIRDWKPSEEEPPPADGEERYRRLFVTVLPADSRRKAVKSLAWMERVDPPPPPDVFKAQADWLSDQIIELPQFVMDVIKLSNELGFMVRVDSIVGSPNEVYGWTFVAYKKSHRDGREAYIRRTITDMLAQLVTPAEFVASLTEQWLEFVLAESKK